MQGYSILETVAVAIIPVLFAITFHEVAHGWMARNLGDRTAEMMGRLSPNPLKHIDPIGTVLVPLLLITFTGFAFGWAKPVPVATRNFKTPGRDMAVVAVAGPAANVAMALVWAVVLRFFIGGGTGPDQFIAAMALIGLQINVILAVFNMLPIPPLDGGRVLVGVLPPRQATAVSRLEPYGIPIVLVLIVSRVLTPVLTPMVQGVQRFVLNLAGF